MKGALAGIRVLDLSELLPGPFFTSVLADLGAEVIKLERPGGDPARGTAPGLFSMLIHGKQIQPLDLKSDSGRRVLEAELDSTDILVEGFRPGVMGRLGFGAERILADHPRLVYVSLSGFGQTGPKRDIPGHDNAYAAACGALSLAGEGDQPAWSPGVPVADLSSSLYAAIAVLASWRERDRTGRGGHLDVSIAACLSHWLNPRIADFAEYGLSTRAEQRRYLQDRPAYGTFACADGQQIAIAAMENHFWSGLVDALELAAWRDDQWRDAAARRSASSAINDAIRRAVATMSSVECLGRLDRFGVPAHKVLDVGEALDLAVRSTPERVDTSTTPPHYAFPVLFT
jgi:CoA:oxalate CoA-transferase